MISGGFLFHHVDRKLYVAAVELSFTFLNLPLQSQKVILTANRSLIELVVVACLLLFKSASLLIMLSGYG